MITTYQTIPLIEPIYCPEIFATGFLVQRLSSVCVRLVFFTECVSERVTVAKIIRPIPLLVAGDKLLPMAAPLVPAFDLH